MAAKPASKPRAKKPKEGRYLLPANMEIGSLQQVHDDLLKASSQNDGSFILDGADLSVIDTAGIQLIISFVSTLTARGRQVRWENYSVHAYQLANELGTVNQLGD